MTQKSTAKKLLLLARDLDPDNPKYWANKERPFPKIIEEDQVNLYEWRLNRLPENDPGRANGLEAICEYKRVLRKINCGFERE